MEIKDKMELNLFIYVCDSVIVGLNCNFVSCRSGYFHPTGLSPPPRKGSIIHHSRMSGVLLFHGLREVQEVLDSRFAASAIYISVLRTAARMM